MASNLILPTGEHEGGLGTSTPSVKSCSGSSEDDPAETDLISPTDPYEAIRRQGKSEVVDANLPVTLTLMIHRRRAAAGSVA